MRTIPLAAALLAAAGCGPRAESAADTTTPAMTADSTAAPQPGAPNTLTDAERADGWRLLFDGTSTAGWRGYGKAAMPDSGWSVVDGSLVRTGRGGDIVAADKYKDFELAFEWKVPPGGNSGVFYRAIEDSNAIYMSAPEYQVLDDERHVDGKNPLTSAGAAYGLYAPPRGVVKPAGEWNAGRIVVAGSRVEHWLNGRKVAEYELQGADWKAKVAASKFKDWPTYGTAAEGYIGLQDYGDRVEFRSIKVRTR